MMFILILASYIFALLISPAISVESGPPLDLTVELTENTIDALVAEKPHFVLFYAKWSGHSNSVKSKFVTLSVFNTGSNTDVVMGQVNCVLQLSLCKRFEVKSYPKILLLTSENTDEGGRQIKSEVYKGRRVHEAMKKFIVKRFPAMPTKNYFHQDVPPTHEAYVAFDEHGVANLSPVSYEMMAKSRDMFVMYGIKKCPHCKNAKKVLQEFASEMRHSDLFIVAYADCKNLEKACAAEKIESVPVFKFIANNGSKVTKFAEGERTVSNFFKFAVNNSKRLAHLQAGSSVEKVSADFELAKDTVFVQDFDVNIQVVKHSVILFYGSWHILSNNFMEAMWPNLQARFADEQDIIQFLQVDCTNPGGRELCRRYSITSYPSLIIHTEFEVDQSVDYLYEGLMELNVLSHHLQAVIDLDKTISSSGDLKEEL